MSPGLEVADIFRRHGPAYVQAHDGHLGRVERRVMSAIELCRTAALGGHVEGCRACGAVRVAYNSCRNRHCPKCQSAVARDWLEARADDLLPVPYFHVVFTLPIGVWLGIIAWRTGSIWPGIVCHAALNGLWNVWGILVMKEIIPALVAGFASLGIILLAVLGFALSVPILARLKPPMPAGPSAFLPQARPVWPPAAVPIAVPVLPVATNSAPPAIQHDKPADPGVSS